MSRSRNPPKATEVLAARTRFGDTDQQAADAVGVDVSTWRGWERGRHAMPGALYRWYLLHGALKTAPAAVREWFNRQVAA